MSSTPGVHFCEPPGRPSEAAAPAHLLGARAVVDDDAQLAAALRQAVRRCSTTCPRDGTRRIRWSLSQMMGPGRRTCKQKCQKVATNGHFCLRTAIQLVLKRAINTAKCAPCQALHESLARLARRLVATNSDDRVAIRIKVAAPDAAARPRPAKAVGACAASPPAPACEWRIRVSRVRGWGGISSPHDLISSVSQPRKKPR